MPSWAGARAQLPEEPYLNGSFGKTVRESSGSELATSETDAISIEYNTAAQKLFRWKSIKGLLQQSKELNFSVRTEGYITDYETSKGVLRIYGRGRQSNGSPDDGSPATSPESLWGTAFVPTIVDTRVTTNDSGDLNPDNTLKLDPSTMARLLRSYLDHLHALVDVPLLLVVPPSPLPSLPLLTAASPFNLSYKIYYALSIPESNSLRFLSIFTWFVPDLIWLLTDYYFSQINPKP